MSDPGQGLSKGRRSKETSEPVSPQGRIEEWTKGPHLASSPWTFLLT
jgi:hypothetical protein